MDPEPDSENNSRLHILRLQLLERLIEYLPKLSNVGGVRVIPFFQVIKPSKSIDFAYVSQLLSRIGCTSTNNRFRWAFRT